MFQRSYLKSSPYKLVFHEADDELNEINNDNTDNDDNIDNDDDTDKFFNRCDDYENEIYNSINSINDLTSKLEIDEFDNLQQYNRRKRRQLPKTPDKKPFQKLIDNNLNKNRKIIRQISNTLSLEIELINNYPKSIKLVNQDNELDNKLDKLNHSIDYRSLNEQLNLANEINSVESNNNQNKIEGNYRGLHRFIARHDDEISIDIGDEIFVIRQENDLWFKGINLTNNQAGYFPNLYVIDSNYDELFQTKTVNYFGISDDDSGLNCDDGDSGWLDCGKQRYQIQKERFCLEFLGSLEVKKSKGKEVLDECIKKIVNISNSKDKNQLSSFVCVIEITDCGIRFFNQEQPEQTIDNNLIEDKLTNQIKQKDDYFFHLKNITYCDYLDLNSINNLNNQSNCDYNYFSFITKHPSIKNKYASHCFMSKDVNVSKYICESIANAFHRYYQNFIELTQNYKD